MEDKWLLQKHTALKLEFTTPELTSTLFLPRHTVNNAVAATISLPQRPGTAEHRLVYMAQLNPM